MICNVCKGTGFVNIEQIPEKDNEEMNGDIEKILSWINNNDEHDVAVCGCCGNGDAWYGEPGSHYITTDDRAGGSGPYAYNGGLCECH